MKPKRIAALLFTAIILSACSVMPPADFPREQSIDVDRFMGQWYVIAHIPPSASENSFNNIESYSRDGNKINTVFTFREGSFTGEEKTMKPTGYVVKKSNGAVWGMRFFWPLKMEYTISYVSKDYDKTVVARSSRDYVWIMARKPIISKIEYAALKTRVADLGYDTSKLRDVPQQPLGQRNIHSYRK